MKKKLNCFCILLLVLMVASFVLSCVAGADDTISTEAGRKVQTTTNLWAAMAYCVCLQYSYAFWLVYTPSPALSVLFFV